MSSDLIPDQDKKEEMEPRFVYGITFLTSFPLLIMFCFSVFIYDHWLFQDIISAGIFVFAFLLALSYWKLCSIIENGEPIQFLK